MLAKVSPKGLPAAPIRNKNRYGMVHFSSQTDLWATPQWLYDKLDTESRNFISRLICAPRLLPSVDCGYSDAEFLFSYDAC